MKLQPKVFSFFLLSSFVILLMTTTTFAMPEILPVDQIRSGMRGKGYTVVDDTGVIRSFDVDIINVTDANKGSKRLIMSRASGSIIDRYGGVLQGMSGSPIYIDGKLVGALSSALREMDTYTFFIMPIEDMIEMWNLPDLKAQINYSKVIEDISSPTEFNFENFETIYLKGFTSEGEKFLLQELKELGSKKFQIISDSIEEGINLNAELSPGMPLGVAMTYGDFSIGATGTVTVVDEEKVLALGHPFTHLGNVNYFLTDASVIGSIGGLTSAGLKMTKIGQIIGRVNQDREAGISAILGKFPSVVPVTVNVKDNTNGKEKTFHSMIAYNEDLIPRLGTTIVYTALSKVSDSLAEGTVEIEFDIQTNAMNDGKVLRENVFYDVSDVGQIAVTELMQVLDLICSNPKKAFDIFNIDVNISFEAARRTASIVSIVSNKEKVSPGETLDLTVELQPYRGITEKVTVPFTVPLTTRRGDLVLDVHGGAMIPIHKTPADVDVVNSDTNQNCEDQINSLLETAANNEIVVEIGSANELKSSKKLRKEIEEAKKAQKRSKNFETTNKTINKIKTKYVIDNSMQTIVTVRKG